MNRVLQDIADYMQEKQFLTVFLVTLLLLLISFVSHTRFTETAIIWAGQSHSVHISYYGSPLEMVGIYTPMGDEMLWIMYAGEGMFKVLWTGLALNFALFFAASFFLVYLIVRVGAFLASKRNE
jgi:hypothetical protein